MADKTKKSGIFERSYETGLLVDNLGKLSVGDEISYETLSKLVGYPIRTKGHLNSAREILLKEEGILFEVVRGQGLRRCDNEGALGAGRASQSKISRETRRGLRKLGCANPDELDDAQRIQFNVTASVLGALQEFAKAKTAKRIESAVKAAEARLPVRKTLEAFGIDSEESDDDK